MTRLPCVIWAFERAFRCNLFAKGAKRIFTSIPNAKPSVLKNKFSIGYFNSDLAIMIQFQPLGKPMKPNKNQ